MTADYGVHIRNTFDLLDEDAPPKQSKPKEAKEEPKKEVKRTSDRARPNPRVEGGDRRVDGGDRGRGGGARGGRGGRGRGGGGGGGGGGEGGRERREYDGHVSRSGKTREPKKEGAGKFNEGSSREIIADGTAEDRRRNPRRTAEGAEETPAESKDQPEGAEVADAATGDAPEEKTGKAVEVEPEEPATRTYDEFLASKQKLDADLAIQRREAQNDESQFKAVKIIAKSEEKNPYIISSAAAAEEKDKPAKAKKDKAKHMSLEEFTATAASNSANRGGYRGRGGRGRGRGGDFHFQESQFPGLGPKEKK